VLANSGSGLPDDVQALLRERIASYEQLALLLLLRARVEQTWTVSSVASELRLPEAIAEEALQFLCGQKLVARVASADGPRFTYNPGSPELAALVEKLAKAYDEKLLDVMRLMTTNAIERLRTNALSTFADAFLLKRGEDEDG
jgi:hypothetical protein